MTIEEVSNSWRRDCGRRKKVYGKGGMSEVGLGSRGPAHSPDSDCNSNHPGSASILSNTSSQDIDFIQDNSDYQWFLDYGYRDNHHTSILSLPESYEADADLGYYDALAKNMDANLAEADIESFRTEDIHALLTNLPPMCTDQLSQESQRQGESYASVSGSMMGKFDFDSSMSPHSSSQGEGEDSANSTSMSICKSELLFSPVKETPMPGANFSVDSLDCDLLNEHDIMLTCQANKDNYTIAFEGSLTLYSEDSDYHDYHDTDKSGLWSDRLKVPQQVKDSSMSQSDSASFTTWSKLKKRCSDNQLRRRPSSGNNNHSGDELALARGLTDALNTQSMPNLYKRKLLRSLIASNYTNNSQNLSNSSVECCTIKRRPVKVFDIQLGSSLSAASGSDMATSADAGTSSSCSQQNKPNFNLVKLFMKQKSMSAEGMSTSSASEMEAEKKEQPQFAFEDSLTLDKRQMMANVEEPSTNDVIIEEEESSSRSESVEQLSESVKSEEFNNNNNNDEHSVMMNKSIQTSTFHYKLGGSTAEKQAPVVRVVEASFLKKLKNAARPVYVLYPDYVLPDLGFLKEKEEDEKVVLLPQKTVTTRVKKARPFSCDDVEALRKKGFAHVRDWDSLNFLLPNEYKELLADVPEVAPFVNNNNNNTGGNGLPSTHVRRERPSFCRSRKPRPVSCDCAGIDVLERAGSLERATTVSSTSSTNTQPSSGYRGSSSLLADSQNSPSKNNFNPLFVYRYDSATSSEASVINHAPPLPKRGISLSQEQRTELPPPPRPPLPRGILRNNIEQAQKRHSLDGEPPPMWRRKLLSETEDEGVDAGITSSSSLDEPNCFQQAPTAGFFANISTEDLAQLEEFLKMSAVSDSESSVGGEESMLQLRSYVSKFLALRINQDPSRKCVSFAERVNVVPKTTAPNNSPNVSALLNQRQYQAKTLVDMPICEVGESSYAAGSPQRKPGFDRPHLITGVSEAVEKLIQHFTDATNQAELGTLGDSDSNPGCAKTALGYLCPALYAVLSDGLKPTLETSFGAIGNSVWQVVEASAQQGPLTKALNELVMRINGEDAITEGLVKFNAFVFGLLNVRSLDAWVSYLRTRESLLKKHYAPDSLLVLNHTGAPGVRASLDNIIASLQQLALFPFNFDLLFEYRQLHESLKRMGSYHRPALSPVHKSWKQSPTKERDESGAVCLPDLLDSSSAYPKPSNRSDKERPRSCLEPGILSKPSFKLGEDVNSALKKRWSGINFSSKLYTAYDKLGRENSEEDDAEEYTDSLEPHNKQQCAEADGPESLDSNLSDLEKPLNGRKFKKLQRRWEMLSGKESKSPPESPASPTHGVKSKIPRPVASPLKPSCSGIPVPISPTTRTHPQSLAQTPGKKPAGTPPSGVAKKGIPVSKGAQQSPLVKNSPAKKGYLSRPSRLDQLEQGAEPARHATRPSSLPYKPVNASGKNGKVTPPRRAISTSVNRKPTSSAATQKQTPKVVRTLSHRLPSESGHLSYNEGERLKVVLEVDEKWLLCCRGTQKGLVPRSAVIADSARF